MVPLIVISSLQVEQLLAVQSAVIKSEKNDLNVFKHKRHFLFTNTKTCRVVMSHVYM